MNDYIELKAVSESLIADDRSSGLKTSALFDKFDAMATPDLVLELIAEVEGLRSGWYSDECDNLRFWPEELSESKQEVDRLEAEVEALRKDAERYRWLRVNEFDIGSYHPEGDHNHESWFEHFVDQSIDRMIAEEIAFEEEAIIEANNK